MTLTQQTGPYPHWEYTHPESGDRLRIVPERGGIVTEWRCGEREVLYFDQERYADPARASVAASRCCFRSAATCPAICWR